MGKVESLPYVEAHEVDEAKKLIDKQFVELTGKPFGYRPAGYNIAVKIYIRPEEMKVIKTNDGKEVTLWNPPVSREMDKIDSVAALVCAVGPLAYRDRQTGEPWAEGPWARVGDWITINRQSSWITGYRGVTIGVLPDDKISGIIEDPTDITPFYVAPRI